ncbi:MAG: hypothetical protein H6811_01330 [Phycisphaeraceae bacterium]|nr:hypothetical protein [Phycisphaeraceae bacterium]
MSRHSSHLMTLARRLAFVTVVGMGAMAHGQPQSRARVVTAHAVLLPEGAGDSSRATCGFIDVLEYSPFAAGSVRYGGIGGTWRPVYWTQNAGDWSQPTPLPDMGHGGSVSGITDGSSNTIYFAGSVDDDQGSEQPALWSLDQFGPQLFMLPVPDGGSGAAADLISFGDDPDNLCVLICGQVVDAEGICEAAAWEVSPAGGVTLHLLPAPFPTDCCGALSLGYYIVLGNASIAGIAVRPNGEEQAVAWVVSLDGGGWDAADFVLPPPPGGGGSAAQAVVVKEAGGTEAFAGWAKNGQGDARASLWLAADPTHPDDATMVNLPLGLYPQGQVNGIIAVLIGFLAGGDAMGPAGSSAALWLSVGTHALFVNLDALVHDDLGPGLRFAHVAQLLPYVEQGNVCRAAGFCLGDGSVHAVIADIGLAR